MRKLLLVAFLSVVSTGMPAYAVDYLNCREMLRTKNEFAKKLSANNVAFVKSCGITPEKQISIIDQDKRIIKLEAQIKQAWEKSERDQLFTDEARDIEIRLQSEIVKIVKFLTLDIIRVYLIECWETKLIKETLTKRIRNLLIKEQVIVFMKIMDTTGIKRF